MSTRWRRPARGIAVAYVLVLIGLPVALIVARALAPGVATLWASITTPAALVEAFLRSPSIRWP